MQRVQQKLGQRQSLYDNGLAFALLRSHVEAYEGRMTHGGHIDSSINCFEVSTFSDAVKVISIGIG